MTPALWGALIASVVSLASAAAAWLHAAAARRSAAAAHRTAQRLTSTPAGGWQQPPLP